MSLQMQFGSLAIMRVVSSFGTLAVAAHTLAQRWDFLFFMPLAGLGMSAGVLVGQNLGAHQPQRAEKNGWIALAISEGVMLFLALLLFIFVKVAVRVFSSDPALDILAANYLRIAAVGYLVWLSAWCFSNALPGPAIP
jgi:Na+-driven multidrug efflux pump